MFAREQSRTGTQRPLLRRNEIALNGAPYGQPDDTSIHLGISGDCVSLMHSLLYSLHVLRPVDRSKSLLLIRSLKIFERPDFTLALEVRNVDAMQFHELVRHRLSLFLRLCFHDGETADNFL
jgi:hypothetical protein